MIGASFSQLARSPFSAFSIMNCHSAREAFPALLDHRTLATAHLEERAHLAGCPDCQREFAALSKTLQALDTLPVPPPSPRLRTNFYSMLEEEKHSAASALAAAERKRETGRPRSWPLWRLIAGPLAAGGLVAAGFIVGQRSAVTPAPTTPPDRTAEVAAMQQQIQQLQREVSQVGTLVSYSLLQQQQLPANDRLRTVLTSATQENPGDRAIQELIAALAFDTSPNVRLRALEALYLHAEDEIVRAGVVASLPREQNPLVQVAMIDFLAASNAAQARPALERISASETVDENVRTAARRVLAKL